MQLSQVIDGFFIVRRSRLAATTQTNYRYAYSRLVDFFGPERPFTEITADDLRGYLAHLRSDGLAERTVFDNLIVCSALWTFAAKEFGYPHVVNQIEKPKFDKREIEPFTEGEIKRLVSCAEWAATWDTQRRRRVRAKRPTARRDVAILVVLVDTGIRASELCSLRVNDYRQDDGRLHIRHGKGDKSRYVYLGTNAQRVLWRYLMERKQIRPSDPLFATRSIKPMDRNNLRHLVKTIGDNADIANVHPHRFRHTFAVAYLRNGGNIFELQRILGHESLETVKVYLNFAQADLQKAQQANSPADHWRL